MKFAGHFLGDLTKLGQKLAKYGRGCLAGNGWAPGVRDALVCWSTAFSKSSFTKNQGEPPHKKSVHLKL